MVRSVVAKESSPVVVMSVSKPGSVTRAGRSTPAKHQPAPPNSPIIPKTRVSESRIIHLLRLRLFCVAHSWKIVAAEVNQYTFLIVISSFFENRRKPHGNSARLPCCVKERTQRVCHPYDWSSTAAIRGRIDIGRGKGSEGFAPLTQDVLSLRYPSRRYGTGRRTAAASQIPRSID